MNGKQTAPVATAAVILAGGFGTRIQHKLGNLPKPMVEVHGRPFMDWVVRFYRNQGVHRFVLSTGYRAEAIEKYFAAQPIPDVEISCVQETDPLGTAGGFLNAVTKASFTNPDWLVVNGDSLALADLNCFITGIKSKHVSARILALPVQDTSRFGSLQVSSKGHLVNFAEKRVGVGLINAGIYIFKEKVLDLFPTSRPLSFEFDVFPRLLSAGVGIDVEVVGVPFLDIGTPASLAEAERFINDNQQWF